MSVVKYLQYVIICRIIFIDLLHICDFTRLLTTMLQLIKSDVKYSIPQTQYQFVTIRFQF